MLVNRYKTTSFRRKVKNECIFLTRYAYYFIRNGFQNKTILFYPEYPHWHTEIYKILSLLGYNVTNNPKQKFDMVFHWEDTTVRGENEFLKGLQRSYPVINSSCLDISKTRVEEIFQEVFGYGSFVDPTQHQGICVRKSIRNATHDGKIVTCPIDVPEPGYIYQKLLKQPYDKHSVVDYRVPIFGSCIPIALKRYKPVESRFDKTLRAELAIPSEIFSDEELAKIKLFCRTFGLQYGELDIIRDHSDNRIYILDANNTPWSPPSFLSFDKRERQIMLQESLKAFRENFLSAS